ncbi:C-factor [Fulvia fulva]|uniref:C-factor n=1 Tax=Passalora fulva TaxID=5499 RepID=A0A9Q8L4X5_PASFU|nr:C-factor [Fulvia fulva]KAK4635374.1 C-factor [Fulvia fulva]KAK4637205.1 C-factor [Fulvia fulva]UJO10842.1 C-factor [Fulvia fulva]WPV09343.1 C-factor [Fulvia fulva]WPV25069.1 C-factor [Fulvia fulva]
MPNIIITGAANGIGAAFLKAYLQDSKNYIVAVDRQDMVTPRINVLPLTVDVSSQESIDAMVQEISKDFPIDLLIHSAGIRGLVPTMEQRKPDDVAACETMDVMDFDTMMRTFQINAAGTFMLLRALAPGLRKAKGKAIIMSSRMGSVGNNQLPNKASGSAYAYRASKAALNTIVRSFAVDVPDVTFVLCHPGRVETKLVKCKEEGAITAEESVESILPLIEKWNADNNGKFYDRFGAPIEW